MSSGLSSALEGAALDSSMKKERATAMKMMVLIFERHYGLLPRVLLD
jgi:hypothetical protein